MSAASGESKKSKDLESLLVRLLFLTMIQLLVCKNQKLKSSKYVPLLSYEFFLSNETDEVGKYVDMKI